MHPILRSAVVCAVVIMLAAGSAAVGTIALRNYRAARMDFEPSPASAALRSPESAGVPDLRQVAFESADGIRVAGWYAPSHNGAAVVLTHGTNTDRSSMLPEMRMLAAAGFGVLAFDWPGDGDSAGAIRWGSGERNALTAALTWLAARPDVDPARIGGLGFSMGGFVMTQVAALDTRLRAVVIESAPPDFGEYLARLHSAWGVISEWPARWAVRDSGMILGEMSPRDVIGRVSPRPILIVGGELDEIISPAMLGELYAAAREPKSEWLVPQAHHGHFAQAAASQYPQRLLAFFAANLLAPDAALAAGSAHEDNGQ